MRGFTTHQLVQLSTASNATRRRFLLNRTFGSVATRPPNRELSDILTAARASGRRIPMSETMELTEEYLKPAREFARYLLLHVGPLIDEMQLTRNEVELALSYLLAESLSHRPKGIRKTLTIQWQELIDPAAWSDFQSRMRRLNAPDFP